MSLAKIQIRYFPPGINLQTNEANGTVSKKQINLYGINSLHDEAQIHSYVQQHIISQAQFQFLKQYQTEIQQTIKKIYRKNQQKHSRKHKKQAVLKAHKQPLTACKFSKYADFFATSSYDRTCKIWETQTGVLLNSLSGHQNAIFSIDISQNSNRRLIATGSLDRTTKIWSVGGKRFHNLTGHEAQVTKVQFNPNRQHLVSSSMDGLIKVWNLEKGVNIMDLKAQQNGVVNFSHNYQGDQIVSCGFNSVPMIFDLKSGKVSHLLEGQHSGQATCCKFQFTGQFCATAGSDKKCVIWDIGMCSPMQVLEDHQQQILDLDFDPSGSKLATSSADSSVCVYNVNVGTLKHKLKGHQRQVTKVKFNAQGDFILSTGFDGIGRIWGAETGQNLDVLQGHSDQIYSSDISYYGDKIITSSKDSTCIVWKQTKAK